MTGRVRRRTNRGCGSASRSDSSIGTALVEEVMRAGPTTVRLDEPLEALVGRLLARDIPQVVITTSDGVLVGLLNRAEAEAHLATVDDGEEDGPSCCD